MTNKYDFSEEEMLDSLRRSGYMFESEICSYLSSLGFFVESNQVIEDKITGKSREIDLLAEYYNFKSDRISYLTASKIRYVIEIKNNNSPLVLLTKWRSSPNIEDWTGLKEALNIPNDVENYDWYDSYYENLIPNRNIYAQYCSFIKKRANVDLMALHPDNVYEGLSKITQCAEEMVAEQDTDLIYEKEEIKTDNTAFRHFLFIPILLINDSLYELEGNKLNQVESSILVFNYHFNNVPKMAFVFVLTKKGFPDFVDRLIKLQEEVELKMIKTKKALHKRKLSGKSGA